MMDNTQQGPEAENRPESQNEPESQNAGLKPAPAQPVSQKERFLSLDFIRGISVFGILLMNIQVFGNVFASYVNPTVNDDFSGLNVAAWFFTYIFIEQKFYTIFSMLFGAGILLMAERTTSRGLPASKYHYRRNFLLLIFGLSHGFFIWYGDILATYGFFALFLFGSRGKYTNKAYYCRSDFNFIGQPDDACSGREYAT